jgi:prepilin-type N-terminal cleavage/methylation domain-containing protein
MIHIMKCYDKKAESGQGMRKGFTLVETLVAILILSFILMAITALMTRTMQATYISHDREIAAKLLHECLNLIKTKRNRNTAAIQPFARDLVIGDGPTVWKPHSTNPAAFEVGNTFLTATEGSPYLCRRTAPLAYVGQYSHDCPPDMSEVLPGNFSRTATIEKIADYSISVVCEVTWAGGSTRAGTMMYDLL